MRYTSLLLLTLVLAGCDTFEGAAPRFSLRLNGREVPGPTATASFHPAATGTALQLTRARPDDGHALTFVFDRAPARGSYCFGSLVDCAGPTVTATYRRTSIAGEETVGIGAGGLTVTRVGSDRLEGRFELSLEEAGPGGPPRLTGTFTARASNFVFCSD